MSAFTETTEIKITRKVLIGILQSELNREVFYRDIEVTGIELHPKGSKVLTIQVAHPKGEKDGK